MVFFGMLPECLFHRMRDNVRRVGDLEEAIHLGGGPHAAVAAHFRPHSRNMGHLDHLLGQHRREAEADELSRFRCAWVSTSYHPDAQRAIGPRYTVAC
jgi:hypothetical protein